MEGGDLQRSPIIKNPLLIDFNWMKHDNYYPHVFLTTYFIAVQSVSQSVFSILIYHYNLTKLCLSIFIQGSFVISSFFGGRWISLFTQFSLHTLTSLCNFELYILMCVWTDGQSNLQSLLRALTLSIALPWRYKKNTEITMQRRFSKNNFQTLDSFMS